MVCFGERGVPSVTRLPRCVYLTAKALRVVLFWGYSSTLNNSCLETSGVLGSLWEQTKNTSSQLNVFFIIFLLRWCRICVSSESPDAVLSYIKVYFPYFLFSHRCLARRHGGAADSRRRLASPRARAAVPSATGWSAHGRLHARLHPPSRAHHWLYDPKVRHRRNT